MTSTRKEFNKKLAGKRAYLLLSSMDNDKLSPIVKWADIIDPPATQYSNDETKTHHTNRCRSDLRLRRDTNNKQTTIKWSLTNVNSTRLLCGIMARVCACVCDGMWAHIQHSHPISIFIEFNSPWVGNRKSSSGRVKAKIRWQRAWVFCFKAVSTETSNSRSHMQCKVPFLPTPRFRKYGPFLRRCLLLLSSLLHILYIGRCVCVCGSFLFGFYWKPLSLLLLLPYFTLFLVELLFSALCLTPLISIVVAFFCDYSFCL